MAQRKKKTKWKVWPKEVVDFLLTAADWLEDPDLRNMTKAKILSRISALEVSFPIHSKGKK